MDPYLRPVKIINTNCRLLLFLCISVLVSSCSISNKAVDNDYKKEISQGTRANILQVTEKILDRYAYSIDNVDRTGNLIRYVTNWKQRLPSEDEFIRGYENVRTKIIIEGQHRQSQHFRVFFTGITEYFVDGEWEVSELSDDSIQYFDEISYEFNAELARVLYTN